MNKHSIQISEPWDFQHPTGTNVFTAIGLGIIPGPDEPNWGQYFYLLNVEEPFKINNETVKQIICSPRYEGDAMELVTSSKCTIGIARIKPHYNYTKSSKVKIAEVDYFAIGSIKIT